LEQQRPTARAWSATKASSLERLMVEIRVARSTAGGRGHMRRLAVALDGSSASFDPAQKKVRVRSKRESRGFLQVGDAFGVRLKLWMGDRSYTAVGSVRVRGTR
jgi:hypothetical protein